MFERFTTSARQVVVGAQEEARSLGAERIGTEHLLLAVLRQPGVAASALTSVGVSYPDVRAALTRRQGVTDAEALATLGIDLARVRDSVEAAFGPGALSRHRTSTGHIPFAPRAKKVLELSLREALRCKHNYIGTEHILLGLVREGEGLAALILTELGVEMGTLRDAVMAGLGRQAG